VGGGSSLAYSTTLATASLFRPSSRTLFIVTVNGLFDISALVPLALHAVSAAAEPDLTRRRAVIFSGLSALSALSFSLWAVTWRSARSHTKSVGQIISSVSERFLVVPSRAIPLRFRSLQSQCRSPQLWLLSIWAGSLYLRSSFYIVSARAYLQELGDQDGTYLTVLLMMQPVSILFGPLWAAAIDRNGHVRVMFAISILSLAASTCTLLPSLQFQVVTFALQGAVRAGLYPVAIGYLACVFGDTNLGSLTGLMFIGFGLFNLLIYPLMLLSNSQLLGGDVRPALGAIAVAPTVVQLLVVRRLTKLKAGLRYAFGKPWVDLMDGVRSSALHRWGGTLACPICMDPFAWAHGGKGKKLIELRCTHVTCRDCAAKMARAGMVKCPICRHPQLLDPKVLAARSAAWRSAYGAWRQGKGCGAAGEMSSSINSPMEGEAQRYEAGHASRGLGGLNVRALDLASPKRRPVSSGDSWKTPLPKPAAAGSSTSLTHRHSGASSADYEYNGSSDYEYNGSADYEYNGSSDYEYCVQEPGPADTSWRHSALSSATTTAATSWRHAMADLEA